MTITEWVAMSAKIAKEHGWHDGKLNIPEKLALIHSEVSEALEDYRNDNMETRLSPTGKPEGFPTEIADIVIRVFDLAAQMGIDLEKELEVKSKYNATRTYRHGGKKC